LGLAGAALLAWRIRRPERLLFLAAALPMTALYLQHSRIHLDQPWEMRRFVSVTLPALYVAAGWLVTRPMQPPLRAPRRVASLVALAWLALVCGRSLVAGAPPRTHV